MNEIEKYYIAIGSKNPAKIKAVHLAFQTLFPSVEYSVLPQKVDSGVGDQPFGLESTIQGAINRAKNAYTAAFSSLSPIKSQLGIGIEAGMIPIPQANTGFLDFQFCAVYYCNGTIGLGAGPAFEYPTEIVQRLIEDPSHQEMGTIIAHLSGIKNIKKKQGAIGYLSQNILNRAEILKYSVIMALLPLKSPEIYSR